jgi:hypothetical protein
MPRILRLVGNRSQRPPGVRPTTFTRSRTNNSICLPWVSFHVCTTYSCMQGGQGGGFTIQGILHPVVKQLQTFRLDTSISEGQQAFNRNDYKQRSIGAVSQKAGQDHGDAMRSARGRINGIFCLTPTYPSMPDSRGGSGSVQADFFRLLLVSRHGAQFSATTCHSARDSLDAPLLVALKYI